MEVALQPASRDIPSLDDAGARCLELAEPRV